MGQLALGFRSLVIKAAVFVALASLLAWALGGTLWPRPQIAQMQGVTFAGQHWYWQLAVGGARGEPSWVRWTMMREEAEGNASRIDDRTWREVAGPVVAEGALYYAGSKGRNGPDSSAAWVLQRVNGSGEQVAFTLPDRLAVEQQLARLEAGLPLQEDETISQQRQRVLDP